MRLFLDISQGVGLAGACGIRPFLPPLLAGLLSQAGLGVDFSGGDFALLQSWPFLAALAVALPVAEVVEQRIVQGGSSRPQRAYSLFMGALSVAFGALLFAAVLAEDGYPPLPGLVAGFLLALLGRFATAAFVKGARERLKGKDVAPLFLSLYLELAALAAAAVAIFAAPASYALPALFVYMLISARRRSMKKYEGLRILR